jgi:hypothetical protein
MLRMVRILALAIAATLLVAGAALAARPGTGGSVGQAWADISDLNPIALPTGGSPQLIATVTLPVDGKFVIDAAVEIYNTDFGSTAIVMCQLRHGVTFGGTVLDIAEIKLPASDVNGHPSAKVPLTGVVERVGAPAGVNVHVICYAASGAAIANYGNLHVVSVSSLTIQ